MRRPSARILANRVTLYRFLGTQDANGGVAAGPYDLTPIASDIPCSVQPAEPFRYINETTGRIAEKLPYDVLFADDYGLKPEDKIVWTDPKGTTHNLFVYGVADQAGRSAMWEVHAEERS